MRRVMLAALLAVLGSACGGDDAQETTTFDDAPDRVVIAASVGEVTIDGAASGGATVEVSRSEAGEDAKVSITLEDGVLRVGDDCGDDDGCRVSYRIVVAETAEVEVTTAGGNVVVAEVTGGTSVVSGGGNVSLNTTGGPVEIDSGGGNVLGSRVTADTATVATGGGDADVTFDEPVTDLSVTTDGGRLTVQLPGGPYAIDADAGGGNLSVLVERSDDAANRAVLRSAGGDITVYRR